MRRLVRNPAMSMPCVLCWFWGLADSGFVYIFAILKIIIEVRF